MGQIIGSAAKPKRCNLNKLSQLGTPAAGEHILVSSNNSMNAAGQGNFDCYIEGDGQKAAPELELKSILKEDPFFNQLREDVGEKDTSIVQHTIATSSDFTNTGKAVVADSNNSSFGKTTSSSVNSATAFVDVSAYAGKTLKYTRVKVTNTSTAFGIVFFSTAEREDAIVGYLFSTGADALGYELSEVPIPSNAQFVRMTFTTANLANFQAYVEETIGGEYTSGLGKDVQELQEEVAALPSKVDDAVEGNLPIFGADGWIKDEGVSVISEIAQGIFSATPSKAIANNMAVVKGISDCIAPIGKYKFGGFTANQYVYFPIKQGETINVKIASSFGSGSSLYARVANSSENQELIASTSGIVEVNFTASRDYTYLYFYNPSLATSEAIITRGDSLASDVIDIDARVTTLEGQLGEGNPIYYTLSTSYDGYHNAKRFLIYTRLKDNIYVRFRLGLYKPSLSDTNIANTYWRLEESALYTLSNGWFTKITDSELTTSGENEFVIRQTAPSKTDFTGGYHGDEFIYDENGSLISGAFAEFFADGALIDTSADIALTPCSTFFYKERSQMVETANSGGDTTNVGRPIAWHEKRTEFAPNEGYITENRLDMIENVPFYAYTGICCISRWISEFAMGESNPLTAMGDGTTTISDQFANYGNRLVYYKGNGYSARVTSEVIFGDDDALQLCYVFNTALYNKYYRTSQTLTNVSKFKSRMKVVFEKL